MEMKLEIFLFKCESGGLVLANIYFELKKKIARLLRGKREVANSRNSTTYHDTLTQLPNRSELVTIFNESIMISEKQEIAIIVANIDRLHSINELYGREIGDQVIIKIANRLKDVFGNESAIFRENHFFIYLQDIPFAELNQISQQIQKIISKPFKIEGRTFRITVSIGVSHYPTTGKNIHRLLQQAETAMLQVKKKGRNNYSIIKETDIQQITRARRLEFDLQEALNRDELYLVYQPQIHLPTGKIEGAEALLRWEHPKLGSISPAEFIPIAEETGIINEIGLWVIEQAVEEANKWHQQGLKIDISVNVSYVQFKDQDLVENILTILETSNFDNRFFIIEITESLAKDLQYINKMTKPLTECHVRVAIDDFGTGYSSLGVLGNTYVDMIKIDRCFIKDLAKNKKSMHLVKTMLQIAENLGTVVIAEGVEDIAQLNFLQANGCKYAQGYYFSRPVSAEKVLSYVNQ